MHISFLITLALPLLTALARPLPGGQPDSFDLELRTYPLDVDTLDLRSLSSREPEDLEVLLEARRAPPAVPVNKAAIQQARKDSVRATVQANQARKAQGRNDAIRRKEKNPAVRIPKAPKPPAAKGAPKTLKHQQSQAAANQKQRERKQAGAAKFAKAKEAYAATSHLPGRKKVYNINEKVNGKIQNVKYTGADARRAVFNSHLHKDNPVNRMPKIFENRPQGPAGDKSKPIPYMRGKGQEFPLTKGAPGYKGEQLGPARVIIQPSKTGHKFQRVIAHNPSLAKDHPGRMDHFLVKQSPK